jgi:phosphate transport system substrate-binding protein
MSKFAGCITAIILAAAATVASAQEVRLQGAGATFPAPLYARWVAEYQKLHANVLIDYQGIGSGGGIKGITEKTIAFAGSDAPMNSKEFQAAGGADNIIEIPSCAGGVVPSYNVPGVTQDLKFTGAILADIYMGKITKWNDAQLAAINPGVSLPDLTITPVWRTDGSGTNFVFTNYLSTQSSDFKDNIGTGKAVKWPVGQGGKGNDGVAAVVQSTQGALGYNEQNYADKNHIQYGLVQNKNGNFVKATPAGVSAAGAGAADSMKGHILAANIWNQAGADAYPIASFTYLIVYKDLNTAKSQEQAQALVDFLVWAVHDGQKYCADLDYAPLAPAVLQKVEAALSEVTYNGQVVKPSAP